MRTFVIAITLVGAWLLSTSSVNAEDQTTTAVIYPFVLAKAELFNEAVAQVKRQTGIDLKVVDLDDTYYSEPKDGSLPTAKADIYEMDSIFLADFVADGKIQALPKPLVSRRGEYLPVAAARSRLKGVPYGVPHWVCTDFLILREGGFLARRSCDAL